MTAPKKLVYSLEEAAAQVPWNKETLRRAIHNREPNVFPFVLKAKKDSRGKYAIAHTELEAWFARLEDA